MATDQADEQNNKLVKIDGGAVGILDNEAALLKWAVASSIISEILQDQEPSNPKDKDILKHHENTKSFEEKFKKDKEAFQNAFLTYGNPFQEEEISLMHMISKVVLSDDATSSVKMAKEIGKRQYDLFVEERLISRSASLYDNIKKNNLSLFRHKNSIVTSKSKKKIVNLTSDRQLFANLYVACQSRQGDVENFFLHENHSYPISLSEYGRLRKCSNKSDFLKCLEDLSKLSLESPDVEAKIVDGAAFVNINEPKTATTFEKYCFKEIPQQVRRMAHGVSRLDFVFDTYIADSLKS